MAENEPSTEAVEWYDRGLRLGLARGSSERERLARWLRLIVENGGRSVNQHEINGRYMLSVDPDLWRLISAFVALEPAASPPDAGPEGE